VRVSFLGVRGSIPATGTEFARVGGNTSCIALALDGEAPTLLLDAGTGLRRVADLLGDSPFRGTLLLGHLHWDHTIGLPFFTAGDRPDARVRVLLPEQGHDALTLLEQMMSPPHFPITPSQLRGDWTFETMEEGISTIEAFTVLTREIPHKGGRTFGFRIADHTGATIAYLSDHAPHQLGEGPHAVGAYHAAAVELAHGVDVLIHDAQYTRAELSERAAFGHAAAEYAAGLADLVGAQRVLLFHHDPSRTDDAADELLAGVSNTTPWCPRRSCD
jgi:phosphoribosyl 1,2-cyclic phosphodiesterase